MVDYEIILKREKIIAKFIKILSMQILSHSINRFFASSCMMTHSFVLKIGNKSKRISLIMEVPGFTINQPMYSFKALSNLKNEAKGAYLH